MWSEPVTFGGGITIVNGSAARRSGRPARNAPSRSQRFRDARLDGGGVERLVHVEEPALGGSGAKRRAA